MKNSRWTAEEVQFLQENLGSIKVSTIAQKLNRTETAVLLKVKRLGLSNTKSQTGDLTMHQLATLLKVDAKSVKLWIANHGLPCTRKITCTSKKFYFINPRKFWSWAENNKERIDFSKIERQSILPEPDWVEGERNKKRDNSNTYKSWTTNEVKMMMELVYSGNTFYHIGIELNRSPISVQRKYKRTKLSLSK